MEGGKMIDTALVSNEVLFSSRDIEEVKKNLEIKRKTKERRKMSLDRMNYRYRHDEAFRERVKKRSLVYYHKKKREELK